MWEELVCPYDHAPLEARCDWLSCRGCGRGYPLVESVPTFFSEMPPAICPRPASSASQASRLRRWLRGEPFARWFQRFGALDQRSTLLLNGAMARALPEMADGAAGYCVDPRAAWLCEQRVAEGNLRFVAADYRELPFGPGSFGLALLCELPELNADPLRVLQEVHRCLRSDGALWLAHGASLSGRAIVEAALEAGFHLARSGSLAIEPLAARPRVLQMQTSSELRYFVLRPTRRVAQGSPMALRLVA